MNRKTRTNQTIEELNKEYPLYEWHESNKRFWKPSNDGDRITGFIYDIIEYNEGDYEKLLLFMELQENGTTWIIPLAGETGSRLAVEDKHKAMTIEFKQGNRYKIYNTTTTKQTQKTTVNDGRITL